ncbi:molybdopterin-dependent oxidoreductase [Desulfosporosinus sp. BICA1-9]|uniref:molybdopterin-dependent oxidoreductase n=1 Tax=Desulfosporosinus sp. BICA1-9 TaxID=1531958 RepID=UPI00054BC0C5|nr:molybdopterin-dependent oxidoreductase [Desulfosporosinus sp. BICA1-9]KJS49880.1 MAG: hypothetical protein VR66_06060 [Peptococcaceae bacterium BRH_c23]KJS86489.1 MAG: hypothetical protein JL57_16260 [Desulfosporosinus sp. BICA1-9]
MLKNLCYKVLIGTLALALVFATTGCSSQSSGSTPKETPTATVNADIPACQLQVINGSSTVTLTEKELAKIDTVTIKATLKKKDGSTQEQEWVGFPLAKVLDAAGIKEYKSVTATAADGYAKEYTPDMVKAEGTIVGYKLDGKPLDKDGPLEAVLKDSPGNMWVKTLAKITVAQ